MVSFWHHVGFHAISGTLRINILPEVNTRALGVLRILAKMVNRSKVDPNGFGRRQVAVLMVACRSTC